MISVVTYKTTWVCVYMDEFGDFCAMRRCVCVCVMKKYEEKKIVAFGVGGLISALGLLKSNLAGPDLFDRDTSPT